MMPVVVPVNYDGLVVLDGPPERLVELLHAVDLLHLHRLGHVPEVGLRPDPLPALPRPPPPAAVPHPQGPPGRPAADGRASGWRVRGRRRRRRGLPHADCARARREERHWFRLRLRAGLRDGAFSAFAWTAEQRNGCMRRIGEREVASAE